MRVSLEVLDLPLRDPFRIAREENDREITTVIVSVETGDGLTGLGEAWPSAYYGETVATVQVVVPALVEAVESLGEPPLDDHEAAGAWLGAADAAMDRCIGRNGAAKAGLDIALHDAVARGLGAPLHALLGTPREVLPTDFSIGIDEPAVVAERAARAARFPALKIKLGGPSDLETLERVREVYGGPIRVDANTGWDADTAERLLPELVRLGVELIEQPFPATDFGRLRWLQERSPLPIVVDESCETIDDLERLVGVVAGVNVKLMKCGGVGPGLRMIQKARALGFKIFLGCMEETSVGVAAAATLAGLVDWVDLDGNLLLATEPFEGLELDAGCRWTLSDSPGSGVSRRRVDESVDNLVDEVLPTETPSP